MTRLGLEGRCSCRSTRVAVPADGSTSRLGDGTVDATSKGSAGIRPSSFLASAAGAVVFVAAGWAASVSTAEGLEGFRFGL